MRRLWTAWPPVAFLAVVCLITTCVNASHSQTGGHRPHHVPLFAPVDSTQSSQPVNQVRRLHTSLATLLPVLPLLSPAPSHTLLVTLATPAFKPLLFNWLCFLRYKAHWGQGTAGNSTSSSNQNDRLLKVLIVTSDEGLARELSDERQGLVVWWLKGVDPHDLEKHVNDLRQADKLEDPAKHDLFKTLRTLDLLLPPEPPTDVDETAGATQSMLEWGSLHYQSLMLERTLVMSALVGALSESQAMDRHDRLKAEQERWDKLEQGDDPEQAIEGVRGVLLVDNDAVWLSDPSALLDHAYFPGSLHPSFIWSPDTSPDTPNSYGTFSMPCACFIYSRTSDKDSSLASFVDERLDTDKRDGEYRPSKGAALAWRWTAMCHIAMVMNSFEKAQTSAAHALSLEHAQSDDDGAEEEEFSNVDSSIASSSLLLNTVDNSTASLDSPRRIKSLVRAHAPSFQATSLGPALFLAEKGHDVLGNVEHQEWVDAISSGEPQRLLDILDRAGLGLPSTSEEDEALIEEQERLAYERQLAGEDDDYDFDDAYDPDDAPREDEGLEEFLQRVGRLKGREWMKRHSSSETDNKSRLTCDKLAQKLALTSPRSSSPMHDSSDDVGWTTLTREYIGRRRPNPSRIKTQSLPYDLFPPGMRYFGLPDDVQQGISKGTKVCVVHANYATGMDKENLLRKAGLWALVQPRPNEYMCDANVMREA
ncbi:hypothetical protein OIV83_004791 [Microbotryomycetes sp. JL201]|nr:hypothetical protein OIV83_004791 [Microbotryomycetes sp. JL201]